MSEEYKAGMIAAYKEVQDYAASMVATDPAPLPWLDMAYYASTSIDDLIDPVEEPHG